MQLIQLDKGTTYLHGLGDSVSELIAFYYEYRKHWGYMQIVDNNDIHKLT